MPANFESGVFVRRPAWHYGGIVRKDYGSLEESLRDGGLTWRVEKEPAYDKRGRKVDGLWLVVRDRDQSILGNVGDIWKPHQPAEACEFMDDLMRGSEGSLRIESAGSLRGGRRIWVQAKAPSKDILGDRYDPYLGIVTSFDGTSGTSVVNTVNRFECENTVNWGLTHASRKWSCRHTSKLEDRLAEARQSLKLAGDYFSEFAAKAERYAKRKVSSSEFHMLVNELFGDEDMMSATEKSNRERHLAYMTECLQAPDLANFKGTAWHAWNALADFESHPRPLRQTAGWQERAWESFVDGNQLMLKAERVLDTLVAA